MKTAPAESQEVVRVDLHALARKVFYGCLAVEILLVIADAVLNYGQVLPFRPLRRVVNIAREDGLASWFGIMQTFTAGGLLLAAGVCARQMKRSCRQRVGWFLAGFFFILLALDDGTQLHERIGSSLKSAVVARPADTAQFWPARLVSAYPSYHWQLAVGPLYGMMGIATLAFLWRMFPAAADRQRLVLALACLAAAVALDFFEGLRGGHEWLAQVLSVTRHMTSHFQKSFEEFLELFGMTLFLVTFLGGFPRGVGGICFAQAEQTNGRVV